VVWGIRGRRLLDTLVKHLVSCLGAVERFCCLVRMYYNLVYNTTIYEGYADSVLRLHEECLLSPPPAAFMGSSNSRGKKIDLRSLHTLHRPHRDPQMHILRMAPHVQPVDISLDGSGVSSRCFVNSVGCIRFGDRLMAAAAGVPKI
jgi:hypothetical protein